MTDFDLDRLGDVWRQQPDPAEMERLQKTAARVSGRARLRQRTDIGASLIVAAIVILLVILNPGTRTLLMGGAAILVLLGSNIRQRRLRQVELKGLTGGTEEMLDRSIDRIGTTQRHNRISLIGLGPAIVMGSLFAAVASRGGGSLLPHLGILWTAGWIAAAVALSIFLAYSIRRGRRELERLKAMRESYREEHESSAP